MFQHLDRLEYVRLHISLEVADGGFLPSGALLRLRRDLVRAARRLASDRDWYHRLFDPPVPADPEARRRFQKPGPPFVMTDVPLEPRSCEPGDALLLKVAFFGSGIQLIPRFLESLAEVGRIGLEGGEVTFEPGAIAAEAPSGGMQEVSFGAAGWPELPVLSARWLLETQPAARAWWMAFQSPARIMTGGRPLFRADLGTLFPFVLRRVTSFAHAHGEVSFLGEAGDLIAAAGRVEVMDNRLAWRDWRRLEGPEGGFDLGGLAGSLLFATPPDREVLDLLHLCSLLNLGKGAAYGAGQFRLLPVTEAPGPSFLAELRL